MEKRHQQKTAMILKYAKRRFDGGPEVDLIRSIERQNQTEQLGRMYNGSSVSHPEAAPTQAAGTIPVNPASNAQMDAQANPVQFSPVAEAVLMGPLQISVGAVGMLTAALAVVTFHQAKNEVMVQQAKQVFSDCLQTFKKGVWDLFCTPVRVFKASRRAKA